MNWRNKTTYQLLAIIAMLLILVIFTLQNSQSVEVTMFFWTFSMSSALVMLLSLTLGLIIGWLGIPLINLIRRKNPEDIEEK
ncbi:DUF1049 domain-containing protein [bacterium]|nr:DUF1049 domain-containing protein [bacterium]